MRFHRQRTVPFRAIDRFLDFLLPLFLVGAAGEIGGLLTVTPHTNGRTIYASGSRICARGGSGQKCASRITLSR
jgi:hypothetical protein